MSYFHAEETPHYHRRRTVSLLSSEWGQVGPARYGRQEMGSLVKAKWVWPYQNGQ
jgi:hypothetical protein